MKNGFSGERSIVLPEMIIEMERQDPLVSSLYITDIGYYPHARRHFRERHEPIRQNVLIYCVEGSGWYRVNDSKFEVEANQFFILPAGSPHAYGSSTDRPWTIYWVHFTGDHAAIYAQGAQQPQDVKPSIHSRISDRNNIFEEIFNTLTAGYDRETLRYVSSLLHYYLASMRYIQQFRASNDTGTASGTETTETLITTAAIHYMRENIEKRLTLQEMATYTGFSASHFSALFKQQTGQSPLNYFNLLKIQAACRMLQETDMRINQICHKVGIADSYYFSRLFTKIMGVPPKQYKIMSHS
jgi:AraC-like DNA-binding protein